MSITSSLPSTRARLVMGTVLLLLAVTVLSGAAQAGPSPSTGNHVHIYVVGGSRSCNSPGTPPMFAAGTTVTVGFCVQNALGQGQGSQPVAWSVQGASVVGTPEGQTDSGGEAQIQVRRLTDGQAIVKGTWSDMSAQVTVTWGVELPPTDHIHLLTEIGTGEFPCHTEEDVPPGLPPATAASTDNHTVGTDQTLFACVHDEDHEAVPGRAVFLDPGNLGSASAPSLVEISDSSGEVTFTYTSDTAGKTQSSARADEKVSAAKMTITWHRDTDHLHAFVQGAGGCETHTDPVSVPVGTQATVVACVHGDDDDGIPDSDSEPSTGDDAPRIVGWSYQGEVGEMTLTSPDSSRTDVNGQARVTVQSNEVGEATITAIQGSESGSVTVNYVPGSTEQPTPEANSGPDASSWDAGRLDLFAAGSDNQLIHRWYNGSWSGWEGLGGQLTADPTAVSWGTNRIDVFVQGTDGGLWHRWWDGSSWKGYEGLGGQLVGGPDAASWQAGRLDIFARGTDNALWHTWYDGTWHGWESLGGQITSDPTAVSWGPNRLDVFARGTDNAIWQISYNGTSWSGWSSRGGVATSSPDVSSWASGRLDLFVRGNDNAIWHTWYDGTWHGYQSIGGSSTSDPGAISWGLNRIDLFVKGTDNAIWHAWWDGVSWKGYESLGAR